MESKRRVFWALGSGFGMLILLVGLSWGKPFPAEILPVWVLFSLLNIFTTTFGFPFGGGIVSLIPMVGLASYLVMGWLPASWAAFLASLAYGGFRQRFASQLGLRRENTHLEAWGISAVNASIQAACILATGAVYQSVGGSVPLTAGDNPNVIGLGLAALVYLGANYLLAGLYIIFRGRQALRLFLRSLPRMALFEMLPMVFAPLMAEVYTDLGFPAFAMLSLVFVAGSLIARGMALAAGRLERRVRELDSLQAVGKAMSASLDLNIILRTIQQQVTALMPADNFYIALFDANADLVTFPLAIEQGKPVHWRARQAGNGLTEYVIRTREALLIREKVGETLARLEIIQSGKPAQSWLGVPILAGDTTLGVLAVQSFSAPFAFDEWHRDILVAIASQASMAIQNARLFARTDEALANRVQELDSILRTTSEGILLLDTGRRIVTVNRALAGFIGVEYTELLGSALDNLGEKPTLVERLGYTVEGFQADCSDISADRLECKRQIVALPGPPALSVERTMTPVRDRDGVILAWLLVLRDRTEEVERERAKEATIQMLVHDLRVPLSTMLSSISMVEEIVGPNAEGDLISLIDLSRRGGERMLRMVNQLLDINKLENGKMALRLAPTDLNLLLGDVSRQLSPLINEARLEILCDFDAQLPSVSVDAEAMGRVFYNLVDNAIKFTPDGGKIGLRTAISSGTKPSGLVSISDTGRGFSPEVQHKLFKKFERITTVPGRRPGTGLGLAYCKLVVEAHGGEIWAESIEGRGSTFFIRLYLDG